MPWLGVAPQRCKGEGTGRAATEGQQRGQTQPAHGDQPIKVIMPIALPTVVVVVAQEI